MLPFVDDSLEPARCEVTLERQVVGVVVWNFEPLLVDLDLDADDSVVGVMHGPH